MRRNRRTSALSIALLATSALALPGISNAQEAGSDDGTMDEIVVTAQKRSENLQDVPISIAALGSAKLEQANVQSFDDYAKLLPSVSFQSFGPGQSQIFFRGVSSGGDGLHIGPLPTSSLYIDEIPVTTIFGSVDFHVYDIARVEALAGPQGTLFGASSLSGTLRMITNQPSTSGTSGAIDLQLNKFGKGDMGGTAEGFVNLPLSDNAALRIVGFYDKQGGYIDNLPASRTFTLDDGDPTTNKTVTNAALVKNDYNDVETYGGRAALKIDLDDNWTVTPQIIYQHQVSHGGFLYDPSKGDLKVTDFLPSLYKDRWYQAALTITGKISDWDLTYSGGYFDRKVHNAADYSYYSVAYDHYGSYATYYPDGNGGFLDPTQNAILGDKYTKQTHELRISSPSDKRMRLTAGTFLQVQTDQIAADYEIQGTRTANLSPWLTAFPGTDTVFLTRLKRKDRDFALFGQGEFDLSDKLTVIAGLRWFKAHNTIYGFSGTNSGGNLATCVNATAYRTAPCVNVDKGQKEDGFIWRGGLRWKVSDDVMLYGTVSRGYRPGGNNRRPGVNPYTSDTLDNFELGWKTRFANVTFNGAVFYEKWKALQFGLVPLGQNGVTNTYNAGDARIFGIEADIAARFGGLTLSAAATYVDAQLTSDFCQVDPLTKNIVCVPGTAPAAAKGTRLPVMPKFKGTMTARYTFPLGSTDAFVQGVIAHQGGTRSFLTDADYAAIGPTKAFTTVDFSLGTTWDKWRVEAFLQNAFDSRGVLSRNTVCATQICGTYARNYPTKPRLMGIKAGYDF